MKKLFIILMCALLITIPCFKSFKEKSASAYVINWGLNPNTREETPGCPDGAESLLTKYNGMFVKETDKKEVFFTFDLGYEAGHTAKVLDILKENNIKATFFLCGEYLKQQELVERIVNEGHTIGNHTNHHKDLPNLSKENIAKDIQGFTDKFSKKYPDKTLKYFRPPKGRIDEKTLETVNGLGLKTIMWSIAFVDWQRTPAYNAVTSANKVASRVHPGAVILMHIANPSTPKMVETLIPLLKEKGYQIADPNQM